MKIQSNFADAPRNRGQIAFTLMEVMIAMGIFFMAVFTILALVTSNLRNARLLQEPNVDTSMVLGDLYQTNILTEGSTSGDYGDLYPGYGWRTEVTQVATNGFFQIDLYVRNPNGEEKLDMSVNLWRPASPPQGAFAQ